MSINGKVLELLSLCVGDSPDKAFVLDINESATVSRLRSTVSQFTRHNPSDLNIFAVNPDHVLTVEDNTISAFLATVAPNHSLVTGGASTSSAGMAIPLDPAIVERHLPVIWLKNPAATIAQYFPTLPESTDGEHSMRLRLLVALDARTMEAPTTMDMSVPPSYEYAGSSNSVSAASDSKAPLTNGPMQSGSLFGGPQDVKAPIPFANRSGTLFGSESQFPDDTKVVPVPVTNVPTYVEAPQPAPVPKDMPEFLSSTTPAPTSLPQVHDKEAGMPPSTATAARKRKLLWIAIAVVMGLLLIAAVVVGVLLWKRSSSSSSSSSTRDLGNSPVSTAVSTSSPTSSPTPTQVGALVAEITGFASDSIKMHPNGKVFFASERRSGDIAMVDVDTKIIIRRLSSHLASVFYLTIDNYLQSGPALYSFGADNNITVWELDTGRQLAKFSVPDNIMSGAVSPDGQYLFYPIISGSDETGPVGGINRINLATGTTDTFAVGRLRPSALKAQSGTSVFVGAGYGYLGRWDLSGRTWREAQRLRFNNNSEITFPASPTNDTVFWNEQRNQYDIRYLVVRGNTLFAAVAFGIHTFDLTDLVRGQTYVFFANAVNDMDVNADGSRVAIADADNKVVIWNGPQSPSTFWLYNTKWEMHGVSIAGDSLVASGSGAAFQLLHV